MSSVPPSSRRFIFTYRTIGTGPKLRSKKIWRARLIPRMMVAVLLTIPSDKQLESLSTIISTTWLPLEVIFCLLWRKKLVTSRPLKRGPWEPLHSSRICRVHFLLIIPPVAASSESSFGHVNVYRDKSHCTVPGGGATVLSKNGGDVGLCILGLQLSFDPHVPTKNQADFVLVCLCSRKDKKLWLLKAKPPLL